MPPKDAKKASKAAAAADEGTGDRKEGDNAEQRGSASGATAGAPPARRAPPPADGLFGLGRGVTNLLVHSLLMVAVPFSIFFGSYYGYFNRKFGQPGWALCSLRAAGACMGVDAATLPAPATTPSSQTTLCREAIYAATFGLPEERNKAIPAAILAVLSVQLVSCRPACCPSRLPMTCGIEGHPCGTMRARVTSSN